MRKNLFYNTLLSVSNILFPIMSFPYAARIIGPAGIGKAQFVFTFAQYFALFAALGIPLYGIKAIASIKDQKQKLATTFFELTTIYFFASLFVSIVYFILIFNIPFFEKDLKLYLVAGCLTILSFSNTDWYYTGIESFKTISIRSIVVKIISLLLLYLFVTTSADLLYYLFILVFSILGNQLYSFIDIISKNKFNGIQPEFKKHIKPLLYIFGATLASSIYTIWDTLFLGFLSTETAVGYYTAAVKLTKLVIPVVLIFGSVLMPKIAFHFSNNNQDAAKKLITQSYQFTILTTIPISFGLILLAPELIFIFSGDKFSGASITMQIISFLPILVGLGHLFAFQLLIPMGKNKEVFISMLAGLVVSIISNFILVPILNDKGTAISTVITEIIVTGLYLHFVKQFFQMNYQFKLILQSVALAILFIPIILLTRSTIHNVFIMTIVSIFTCVAIYFGFQHFIFNNKTIYQFMFLKNEKPD